MPDSISVTPVPPKEAIDFFQKKGYKIGFDWRDVEREEHAYAFTVAKVMRNDLLQDIRTAVDDALKEGKTFADFSKDLTPVLQEKGWWGKTVMADPKTGEEKTVQLGSPRRLEIIYDTNLRSARAAGQWERIQRVKKSRPYLRYVSMMDGRERPEHRKMHDIILPVDHPFWEKFYPPNGWKCRCWVQQLSERDLERLGLKVTETDPEPPSRPVLNKRTGEIRNIPRGIDAGFDFNIGKARMKALATPPLNKPLSIPYSGVPASVSMPKTRNISADAILPDDLSPDEYVDVFLREFGGNKGKSILFTDVTGERLLISDDLFKDKNGRLKITKRMRHKHLKLLAETIKNPDEIWHTWEEYPKGKFTLLRRYMARWAIAGQTEQAFILFDVSKDGWSGVTAFRPDRAGYNDKERAGALVYRRPDKK